MLIGEVSSAQLNEGRHTKFARFVELTCQVETRHCHQLKGTPVDSTFAEITIQIVERDSDNLPVVIKVVNDLVCGQYKS